MGFAGTRCRGQENEDDDQALRLVVRNLSQQNEAYICIIGSAMLTQHISTLQTASMNFALTTKHA